MNHKKSGRYDQECEELWQKIKADCVMLMVINGKSGSGFSVVSTSKDIADRIPLLLRRMADELDKSKNNENPYHWL